MVLSDYAIEDIEMAFKKYLKSNTVMPKPADIVKIIDPLPEPKEWCKVMFLEIKRKKRENVFTTNEENKYCEDFIKASLSTNSDERQDLQDVITQSERGNKNYWLEG